MISCFMKGTERCAASGSPEKKYRKTPMTSDAAIWSPNFSTARRPVDRFFTTFR